MYEAIIPNFLYRAGVYVDYEETKLHIQEGLAKMKDLPKEVGGSGTSIPE
ncbi:MAG: hypothetical protein WBK08_14650 [Nitrospira sp.]